MLNKRTDDGHRRTTGGSSPLPHSPMASGPCTPAPQPCNQDTPKVYDVTKYLDDHPGGAEVMLEVAGQDATNMFEDIGHSSDARTEMKKYQIGVLKLTDEEKAKLAEEAAKKAERKHQEGGGLNPLAVLLLLFAIAVGYYYSQNRE